MCYYIVVSLLRREMEGARWNLNNEEIMKDTFGTSLGCIDGRTIDAITTYIRETYGVAWVDMITARGINKILAENTDTTVIQKIKEELKTSIHHHGSEVVVISGHPDCAGNPVTKEEQIEHLRRAYETVENFGLDVDIVLLWVNDDWKTVEEIDYNSVKTAQNA